MKTYDNIIMLLGRIDQDDSENNGPQTLESIFLTLWYKILLKYQHLKVKILDFLISFDIK